MSSLHWEAVRRQQVVDRRHEYQQKKEEQLKELAKKNKQQMEELEKGSKSASYHQELHATRGRAPSACNHLSLDEQRRLEHQDLIKEHFYRSRLRYNDTDCAQQW